MRIPQIAIEQAGYELLGWLIIGFSLFLFGQAMFSLYLMIYTWWHPEKLEASESPTEFAPPTLSFTILLPARHEEDVMYRTVRKVLNANYPIDLMQVMVICEASDVGTIREAKRAMEGYDEEKVRVVTFSDPPVNKPHGLNVGLKHAVHDVVTIFDAEDDIHPDVFHVINTIMLRDNVRVVQAGVQLMNIDDHWFSGLNVMEYFFWFRSRLHFHAEQGMTPLGGNTIFMARALLQELEGWDDTCLTEDADIGVRLSAMREPVRIVYDPNHVTREETPESTRSFIKQRTRWNQGFLQVLMKGEWQNAPRLSQRALAFYTLSYPVTQALMLAAWPVAIFTAFAIKMPLHMAMTSLLPLAALIFHMILNLYGLAVFCRLYGVPLKIATLGRAVAGFIPFQIVLGAAAIRAVWRHLHAQNSWEKTAHVGAHREGGVVRALYPFPSSNVLNDIMAKITPDRATVLVRDQGNGNFYVGAQAGLPDKVAPTIQIRPGEGIVGWVAEHGQPMMIDRRPLPSTLARRLKHPDIRSSVIVPVRRDGEVIAIINIASLTHQLRLNTPERVMGIILAHGGIGEHELPRTRSAAVPSFRS